MAVEKARRCGFRTCGALYLVGGGASWPCGRLPLPTSQPTYRTVVLMTIGDLLEESASKRCWYDPLPVLTAEELRASPVDLEAIDRSILPPCARVHCWVAWPPKDPDQVVGLQWVGDPYSPEDFLEEAREMGISRKVPSVPAALAFGRTHVFLAHRKAYRYCYCQRCGMNNPYTQGTPGPFQTESYLACERETGHVYEGPGLFAGYTPEAVECLVEDDRLEEDWVEAMQQRGVRILPVPGDDLDHARPRRSDAERQADRDDRERRQRRWRH